MTPRCLPSLLSAAVCLAIFAGCAAPSPSPRLVLWTHDVRDIVPPKKSERVDVADPRIEGLIANIRAATGQGSWDHPASIEPIEGGYLLVKADDQLQRKVSAFLEDRHRFATAARK